MPCRLKLPHTVHSMLYLVICPAVDSRKGQYSAICRVTSSGMACVQRTCVAKILPDGADSDEGVVHANQVSVGAWDGPGFIRRQLSIGLRIRRAVDSDED